MASIAVRITADLDQLNRAFREAAGDAEAFGLKLSQVGTVSGKNLDQATEVSRKGLSALGTSARFAAGSIANELGPALGEGVSRLTSLASVATLSGTTMAALATFGIGAVVVALGAFITKTKEAEKAQRELAQAVALGQVPRIQKDLNDLREREIILFKEVDRLLGAGFETLSKRALEAELADVRNLIELRKRQINQINQENIAGAARIEQLKKETDSVKDLAALETARLRGIAAPIAAEGRKAIEAEGTLAEGAADVFIGLEAAKTLARSDAAQKGLDINAAYYGELQRMAIEAEGVITAEQGATLAAIEQGWEHRLEGERQLAAAIAEIHRQANQSVVSLQATLITGLNEGLVNAFTNIVTGAQTAKDALGTLGDALIEMIVRFVAQLIIANTIGLLLGKVAVGATAGFATATAAAWAPAATLATIATLGGAAALAPGAIAGALAATQVIAVGAATIAGTGALIAGGGEFAAAPVPLQHGGIVTGPTLAMLHEGETVIPLDRAGMFSGDLFLSIELDGRTIGNAVFPLLPGYVRLRSGLRSR